jgi:hypothetical protein
MVATGQDFTVYIGDDHLLQFTLTSGGSPFNLTGVLGVKWACAVLSGASLVLPATISKTLGSGVTVINAAGGIVQVAIQKTDTQNVVARTYRHNLEVTTSDGAETTFAEGDLILKQKTTI